MIKFVELGRSRDRESLPPSQVVPAPDPVLKPLFICLFYSFAALSSDCSDRGRARQEKNAKEETHTAVIRIRRWEQRALVHPLLATNPKLQ